MSFVLPQSGGQYEAAISFNGMVITSDSKLCVNPNSQYSISAVRFAYGFSFTGWSPGPSNPKAVDTSVAGGGTLTLYATQVSNPVAVTALSFPSSPSGSSVADLIINSYYFQSGESTYLSANTPYSLSASSFSGSYRFWQWATSTGSLSNATSPSTVLDVGSSGGDVSLISLLTPTNWGGYAVGGSNLNNISATVTLPALASGRGCAPSTPCPSQTFEDISFWVGLGGFYNGTEFWQAGVDIQFSQGSMVIVPWYEALGAGCGVVNKSCRPVYGTLQFSLGNRVSESVATAAGTSTFFIENLNTSQVWRGSVSWTPSVSTAEWIGESPSASQPYFGGEPAFSPAEFSSLGINGSSVSLASQRVTAVQSNSPYYAGAYITPTYLTASTGWAEFYLANSLTG